jgi:hypothetical protein
LPLIGVPVSPEQVSENCAVPALMALPDRKAQEIKRYDDNDGSHMSLLIFALNSVIFL